ncbi:hypothetical protein [Sphingomonas sp.]|uniref:DUF7010 family protein n=1 Tax=Sphingomonas sp. TaxID=28214 RepID=UPI001810C752|nr:hypothetical protein [Sphingomonas sp.]MBA4763519.1 hypothetical protein [Sphingomonas sp.]
MVAISDAQDELRLAYAVGAPGVLVSGLVWLASGAIWYSMGPERAFLVLFLGGMSIFPMGSLIARLMFGARPASKTNPLGALGFEVTVPLFAGIFVAYALLPIVPALSFALFAVIVGARYFSFATLYRDRTYWALGGVLFATGIGFAIAGQHAPINVAICVGALELIFAVVLFVRARAIPRS